MKVEQYHLHKEHPEKLQFEIYDLEPYLLKSGEHATIPHTHSYYQIIWIYNKGGVHYVDFNSYNIENNTIFFISKNQMHYFDKNANHKGLIIHFNEHFLMHSDVEIFLKYTIFNNQRKPFRVLGDESTDLAHCYLKLIRTELSNRKEFGYKHVIRNLLKSLLVILERAHSKTNDQFVKFNNSYELQYFQFREFLETHYTKNYSVADFANKLNMSTKTLNTITNKVVSKTPSQLISERIILEAERLLSFTDLKINEVAYRLGFEDPSYFVKYFKRHVKKSPSEYRALLG
ncbi:AraC family transcriptional regulator [Seonamhaeicola marinus]|uniref:Helix-turn-helix domain-containing protein n=1 Tax=Seonamhaeicola marinus TaxID=1912246 RepID=A0A5D0J9S1_9FLAO|nr:AraC family transcriptional regulator [Seonamhaeicola marinus]TYA92316.1 helix-turn-helix domain-containing protein [Seonamhaeicola marinus]